MRIETPFLHERTEYSGLWMIAAYVREFLPKVSDFVQKLSDENQ
jgi:hypothetical protein